MEGSARLRRMLPGLALALTLALGAVLLASVDVVASSPYSSAAETNLRALDLDLMSAAAAGYTESDLAPVLDGEQLLLRQPPPAWPLARFAYYRNREQLAAKALFDGRNDAAYAAFMRYGTLGRPYDLLESNLAKVQGGDLDQVALATALEERYRDEVHQALLGHLPQKAILVSLTAQELWAYEGGRLVIDTLVTTGRPALPTDVGLMRVNRKESPVHFISPFPHGSPYDYGSINARYALWFHPSGEAIHDSWWRSWYGPGSNVGSYGSHGCIGLPYGPIDVLFSWTPVGTPVVVIPGDGSPPADQVAQQSYNDPYFGYGSPSPDS